MNRSKLLISALLCAATPFLLQGCESNCGDEECLFTESDWTVVQSLSPLPPVAPDPTNKFWDHAGAAILGQKLFFEKSYSGGLKAVAPPEQGGLGAVGDKNKVACASCHIPATAFVDSRTKPGNVSLGTGYTARNAPSLINTVYYKWHGWTGRQDSLWNQASTSPESSDNTGGDRCGYAHMLYDKYLEEYNAIFDEPLDPDLGNTSTITPSRFGAKCKPKSTATDPDGPWEMMAAEDKDIILRILANQGKAVAAYETKLVSKNAPFDKYVAGDQEAISPDAKRGLRLFVGKAACVDCHSGPFFTDQEFHSIGVRQEGPNIPAEDGGRWTDLPRLLSHPLNTASKYNDDPSVNLVAGLERQETDKGLFRTPTLRNIAQTAPYLHTGMAHTLADVITLYNHGGSDGGYTGAKDVRIAPLALTTEEIGDLVAFLETLTGEPIPEELLKNPLQ